jgi:hypothetical protein
MIDKKKLLLLVLISFLIFASKWIASYYLFTESVSTKVIFESVTDGYYYFPLVKYLSILDFNNSFNPNFENLGNIMVPFYSIFLHAFFYKLIGNFSFIVVEFFSIFLFLLILYKIFRHYYSKEISILFAMIIFTIPVILSIFPIGDFSYFKIITNNIYNLRFPRPLITTLYLFIFLYFLISIEKIELFSKRNFFLLGIIMAVTLSSFYYYFFLQVSMLVLYIIYRYKYSFLDKILTNWDSLIIFFLVFIIISLPLLINMNFHEEDYTRRLGLININISQKIILLKHYLIGYLKKEFLAFLLISTIYLKFINSKKIMNYKLINIIFLLFLGSLFAPLLFIVITNKSGILYHFNNTVVISAFLLVFFIILDFFNRLSLNHLNKIVINFISIVLIVICTFFNLHKTTSVDKPNSIDERLEFNIVTNIILKNYNLSKSTLMTFDNRFMVWSVLNDIEFLNLTNFIMTPKKDTIIENDLIKAFKFLNLNADDFSLFIENKKSSWRYINYNLSTFLFYKYMANPIKTFNDSKDFKPDIYNYIKKSSPINFEQTIIPNDELDRLNNQFSLITLKNFNYPDIVIINKKNNFLKKIKAINNYCKIFDKKFFILMLKKSPENQC